MRIAVINANTSPSMTDVIGAAARAVAAPGTVIDARTPEMGPIAVESHYDEALAVPGVLTEIHRSEASAEPADAYVVACFGDPGLHAAREVADGPVLGIAQAAMLVATTLGRRFSVVTTLGRSVGRAEDLVAEYGVGKFCAGVHACNMAPLELHENPDALALLTAACATAVETDRSDVVVLGCAGMADVCHHISTVLGLPVVDGVAAAVTMAEGLVRQGLRTAATAGYAEYSSPPPKLFTGALGGFGSSQD